MKFMPPEIWIKALNNNLSSDHLNLLAYSIDVVLKKLMQFLFFYSLKRKMLFFREMRLTFP